MTGYILSPEFVCDVLKKLEDKKVFPATIRMHIADYAHIRKFGREHLDIETHGELLRTGMMGTLFGLPVKVNTKENPIPERIGIMRIEDRVGSCHSFCLRCGEHVEGFCKTKSCIIQEIHDA
jgi:hypothetical protein